MAEEEKEYVQAVAEQDVDMHSTQDVIWQVCRPDSATTSGGNMAGPDCTETSSGTG